MSKVHDWHDIAFDEQTVLQTQEQKIDWKQNLNGDIKTRWVGKLGELAFRFFLEQEKIPFTDCTQNGASWVDFKVGRMNIDVKTVATNYYPKPEYACNISPRQHNNNHEADTYLFARYIVPERKIVLLGFISKHGFELDALLRMTGSKVTSTFTTDGELMELEIDYLLPIHKLSEYL